MCVCDPNGKQLESGHYVVGPKNRSLGLESVGVGGRGSITAAAHLLGCRRRRLWFHRGHRRRLLLVHISIAVCQLVLRVDTVNIRTILLAGDRLDHLVLVEWFL